MKQTMILAHDGQPIQVYIWEHPTPLGWIHIHHGMAEHGGRYNEFARKMVAEGYSVVAHDHRGHGPINRPQQGHFGDLNGWNKVLQDITTVRTEICGEMRPYYIFGHSMGSFIVQSYLTRHILDVDGLILSGSNLQPPLLSKAARWVTKLERLRVGKHRPSKLIQALSFGAFNKRFKPNRTDFDWLSNDPSQVDAYVADEDCGFPITTESWFQLFSALSDLYSPDQLIKIPKNLPILIVSGDQDPVGQFGNGVKKLSAAYQETGHTDVTLQLYAGKRHELLNELNKEEVAHDISIWLNKRSQQKASA